MSSNPFTWTFHAHSLASIIYPCGVLFYHSFHDSFIYRRYLVRPSPIKADPEFERKVEDELFALSHVRQKPLKNVKTALVMIDAMESSTIGAFPFRYGPMFKFNTRLLINSVSKFRQTFKNFNSFIGVQVPFLEVNKLSDEELANVLLSEEAIRFAISRELNKADSSAPIIVPCVVGLTVFSLVLALLKPLTRLLGSIGALTTTVVISSALTYVIVRHILAQYELRFDRIVYSYDDQTYAKGCETYLEKSMALGRLLREKNGADSAVGRKFAENGDYIAHSVRYSRRMKELQRYLKEEEEARKRLAKKIRAGKIKIQKQQQST